MHSLTSSEVVTRPCRAQDVYGMADVHVTAFYPGSLFAAPLRLDRVLAFKVRCRSSSAAVAARSFALASPGKPSVVLDAVVRTLAAQRLVPVSYTHLTLPTKA